MDTNFYTYKDFDFDTKIFANFNDLAIFHL